MIDIVLVNWNSGAQLREAVASIAGNHGGVVDRIVVVDNDSVDDSMVNVNLGDCQIPLDFIFNKNNLGFGAACNQGAKLCESEYILFLNPDARLFHDSLSVPLDYMRKHENANVGISGIQLIDSLGQVSRTCARFPTAFLLIVQTFGLNKVPWLRSWSHHMDEWDHANDREVDHVIGAFFLVRRELFESLAGFDERFFVYLEDLDISYRARKAGWRSVYLASAQAFHAGGGTSGQIKAGRLFYALRSRLFYAFKHFSPVSAWVLAGATLFIEPVSRSVFSIFRGGLKDLGNTLRGYGMLWRALPTILKNSRK
ncbi:glycosyltransferase family 2 protein [Variovorax sp. Varisp85]|uniref:glycosyltransferase family 2 protein n=1 Tax=Variovorax sp. Varisp85 TaxID=3243059 RepID=UPI0039A4382A